MSSAMKGGRFIVASKCLMHWFQVLPSFCFIST